MFDDIVPAFKKVKDRWPDAPNIQARYRDLVRAYDDKSSCLIEHSKSFLEMACKTILNEIGKKIEISRPTTTKILKETLEHLGHKNTHGNSIFDAVLNSFNKISDALSEIRNNEGFIAHGKDGFLDEFSEWNLRVYLVAVDSILLFLLKAFDEFEPDIRYTREPCTRYKHHNKKIDNYTWVEAETNDEGKLEFIVKRNAKDKGYSLNVSISEFLYNYDRDVYVDLLKSQKESELAPEPEEEKYDSKDLDKALYDFKKREKKRRKKLDGKKCQLISEYKGKFKTKVNPLYDYVEQNVFDSNPNNVYQIQELTYSLLTNMEPLAVVDWQTRDSTRSKVRLMVKKLIRQLEMKDIKEKQVDLILDWLAKHIGRR